MEEDTERLAKHALTLKREYRLEKGIEIDFSYSLTTTEGGAMLSSRWLRPTQDT